MSERQEFLTQEPNLQLAKKLNVAVWVVTALVWVLVGLMRRPDLKIPLPEGVDLAFLPFVNAVLNTSVAGLLVVALLAVKAGKIKRHRAMMTAAMVVSGLFLLCYVAYHFTTPETKYGGEGMMRTVYFIILISHIALAALSFPFILKTLAYALCRQFEKHRKLSRWIYPVWLYVAVTGPVVYLMLRPYY